MDHLSFIVWLYAFLSNMLKEENPSNFQFFFHYFATNIE